MFEYIDFSKPSFWLAAAAIAFNPIFWNIAARQEYHNRAISKLFGGNPYYGCYALAVTIFTIGIIRDTLFEHALRDQHSHPALIHNSFIKPLAGALFASGNILVLTSMWSLGITGTYLGDYFGILMDNMVTGFPFNITAAPMYWGSTMSFLATALWFGKPTGLLLTLEVFLGYWAALKFEDPFTAQIYRKRDEDRKKAGEKAQ